VGQPPWVRRAAPANNYYGTYSSTGVADQQPGPCPRGSLARVGCYLYALSSAQVTSHYYAGR